MRQGDSARRWPALEGLLLLAVTFPLAVWLRVPTLWFVAPLALITLTQRPYADYGLTLAHPGSLRFHAAVVLGVFVPYVLGHYAVAHWCWGADFRFRLPAQFATAVFDQLLIIGLSEEIFFRGYLQTQFDRVWGRPYRFLGTTWGVGLPLAAALFAVCHMWSGGPARLIVFFPGVLYGWLRTRTDTILVPAVYHGVSNLLMQVMLASLGR